MPMRYLIWAGLALIILPVAYRSRVELVATSMGSVATRGGVRLLPDRVIAAWPGERRLHGWASKRPTEVLDEALQHIAARYGQATAHVVAMQLGYPQSGVGP